MNKQQAKIKKILESLYERYNHREFINPDPLQFIYRYSARQDREIAGFLASSLAYGRVRQIEKSLNDLFGRMEDGPFKFVSKFDKQKRKRLENFKHRFTAGDDISDLLELLRKVVDEYGSIESYFLLGYDSGDKNIISALSKFSDSLLADYAKTHDDYIPRGIGYLLTRPAAGSPCKRLNLFLRWMVRKDEVDAGLWKSVDKAKLIVPVDVHMGRLCKILGFYEEKSISLRTAATITDSFAKIMPDDPVKYDFSLSRIGITENCTGKIGEECKLCELFEYCVRKENETK